MTTEFERKIQEEVNFLRMLEILYKVEIKNKREYTHYYEKWRAEGYPQIQPTQRKETQSKPIDEGKKLKPII